MQDRGFIAIVNGVRLMLLLLNFCSGHELSLHALCLAVASTSRQQGDAGSAAGHANRGTPLQQDRIDEEQRDGDSVAAEQHR